MQRYILRRLVQAVITILIVATIIFFLARLSGDPLTLMMPHEASKEDWAAMRHKLGLDQPLYIQYFNWMKSMFRGDFGTSLKWDRPVSELILERFPNTLQLAACAMAMILFFGLLVGILSAMRPGGWFDQFGKLFALLGQAMARFWLGILLILVFSVTLGWFPTSGMGSLKQLVLPSVCLASYSLAAMTRLTRSSMLDVLDTEYIKMARINGLPERLVILKHALKNAMIPIVTLFSLQFVGLLSGSVVVETIFSWPGIGRLVVNGIFTRDYPLVQAIVFVVCCVFVFTNLLVDILYGYLDPRIRYQ